MDEQQKNELLLKFQINVERLARELTQDSGGVIVVEAMKFGKASDLPGLPGYPPPDDPGLLVMTEIEFYDLDKAES
ncbi:hypothetical protein [Alcaligenes sp. WGS1538]|uniref:hypothetical protein n=1 Tax=Alcaligenes sp. WGS1538 TaxID=3366811 RepID=UPI00372D0F45